MPEEPLPCTVCVNRVAVDISCVVRTPTEFCCCQRSRDDISCLTSRTCDILMELPVGPCINLSEFNVPSLSEGLIFYGHMYMNPPVDLVDPPAISPSKTDLFTQDGILAANFKVDYAPNYYSNCVIYSVPNTPTTKWGVENITIMFWFYEFGAAVHAMTILTCGNSGWYNFGKGYSIWINNTFGHIYDYVWHLNCRDGGSKDLHFSLAYDGSGNALNNNEVPSWRTWHLVALTYDGTDLKAYVDGVLRSQTSGGGPMEYNSPNQPYELTVGNGAPYTAQACNGLIPCIKIWNRALTQSEITLLNRPLF
jgi:hypothetical protein